MGLGFGCWARALAILWARKAVRASPSLVTDEIINIGEYFVELSTGELSNEVNRGVEDENPRSVRGHIRRLLSSSSSSLLSSRTESVPRVKN